jgi:hypothetical protein
MGCSHGLFSEYITIFAKCSPKVGSLDLPLSSKTHTRRIQALVILNINLMQASLRCGQGRPHLQYKEYQKAYLCHYFGVAKSL